MIHKSNLIPGLSKFIDENILAHYPPTSIKRVIMASAASLYLKQGSTVIDSLMSNPIFINLGVIDTNGMIDIESLHSVLKQEVNKAGCVKLTIPFIGDIDFTVDDVEALYNSIRNTSVPNTLTNNGGVY